VTSGNHYYHGDAVNITGGRGHTGIVKNQGVQAGAAAEVTPALLAAIAALHQLAVQLREQVPAASAQVIDDSLPSLTADPSVEPQERHRALMSLAGVAGMVGAIGQPVGEAVTRVTELLGL
jgi:hypothetical protein